MSSTYINKSKGLLPDYSDTPDYIQKFLLFLRVRKNCSEYTLRSYYLDIRIYIRYLMVAKMNADDPKLKTLDIRDCPKEIVFNATSDDIEDFLFYISSQLGIQATSMARKISALRALYEWLCLRAHEIKANPVQNVLLPSRQKRRQPIYLSLEQSLSLFQNLSQETRVRDACIILIFLNCGIRVSEMIGINFRDIHLQEHYIKIMGKGNKERSVALNEITETALREYLEERNQYKRIVDTDALFVSQRTGRRLTVRGVEVMLQQVFRRAGLDGLNYSPHKLRHTAATLLYAAGADILSLQQLLGHSSVSTTQIYTHINNENVSAIVQKSPFNQKVL